MSNDYSFWHRPQHDGVMIADLTRCEPRSAISKEQKPDHWYQIPYATQNGIEGIMVAKGELSRPPDLHLELPVSGWHAIYLGIYPGADASSFLPKVKLSDQPTFETVIASSLGHRRAPDGTPLSPGLLPGATYASRSSSGSRPSFRDSSWTFLTPNTLSRPLFKLPSCVWFP